MTPPSTERNTSTQNTHEASDSHRHTIVEELRPESVLGPVRMVSFWAAVVLPFLHLPLLGSGIETRFDVVAFLSLVALNFGALVLGHGHRN